MVEISSVTVLPTDISGFDISGFEIMTFGSLIEEGLFRGGRSGFLAITGSSAWMVAVGRNLRVAGFSVAMRSESMRDWIVGLLPDSVGWSGILETSAMLVVRDDETSSVSFLIDGIGLEMLGVVRMGSVGGTDNEGEVIDEISVLRVESRGGKDGVDVFLATFSGFVVVIAFRPTLLILDLMVD